MNKNYRSIKIFVSHPFGPKNETYDLQSFRENIRKLIEKASVFVKEEYNDFDIDIVFDFNEFIESLPHQVESNIRNCHLGIVDITENKPNIFYEYGLLYGLNKIILPIKAKSSLQEFPLPSDIKNQLIITYSDFDELDTLCVETLAKEFRKLLNSDSLANIYINKIWFPSDAGTIHVIAPPEIEKSEFASSESKNYIFLNNLGDIDTVLEIMTFLNRNFSGTSIHIYSSEDFKNHIEDNLVVIGGPGDPDDSDDSDDDGNSICAMMMDKMNVQVKYLFSEEDEKMVFKEQEFSASYRKGKVVKDYGYFARFPNPFNPKTSVVLVHGIHTFGVLGAAKAFSDHPSAQGNIRKVMQKLNLDDIKQASFECFFPVDVLQQSVVCPDINIENIIPLEKKT